MKSAALLALLAAASITIQPAAAHGDPKDWPINPALGVAGFPDCTRVHPELNLTMEEASFDLKCEQKGPPDSIKIACVGDSITAGVHSTGGNHTYPFQLQMMLDKEHGFGKYTGIFFHLIFLPNIRSFYIFNLLYT